MGYKDPSLVCWQALKEGIRRAKDSLTDEEIRDAVIRWAPLSRQVTIEKKMLNIRIGSLTSDDLERVRITWNEKFRL